MNKDSSRDTGAEASGTVAAVAPWDVAATKEEREAYLIASGWERAGEGWMLNRAVTSLARAIERQTNADMFRLAMLYKIVTPKDREGVGACLTMFALAALGAADFSEGLRRAYETQEGRDAFAAGAGLVRGAVAGELDGIDARLRALEALAVPR